MMSVTQYGELVKKAFPTATVGPAPREDEPAEKEQVMEDFSQGKPSCWCPPPWWKWGWTSNAVIMVIENAEQYGLSQLHQLRGASAGESTSPPASSSPTPKTRTPSSG